MDFDSPAAAQKAVTALKSSGVQAQMAKVRMKQILTSSINTNLSSYPVLMSYKKPNSPHLLVLFSFIDLFNSVQFIYMVVLQNKIHLKALHTECNQETSSITRFMKDGGL